MCAYYSGGDPGSALYRDQEDRYLNSLNNATNDGDVITIKSDDDEDAVPESTNASQNAVFAPQSELNRAARRASCRQNLGEGHHYNGMPRRMTAYAQSAYGLNGVPQANMFCRDPRPNCSSGFNTQQKQTGTTSAVAGVPVSLTALMAQIHGQDVVIEIPQCNLMNSFGSLQSNYQVAPNMMRADRFTNEASASLGYNAPRMSSQANLSFQNLTPFDLKPKYVLQPCSAPVLSHMPATVLPATPSRTLSPVVSDTTYQTPTKMYCEDLTNSPEKQSVDRSEVAKSDSQLTLVNESAATQVEINQHAFCHSLNLTERQNLEAFDKALEDINASSSLPKRSLRARKSNNLSNDCSPQKKRRANGLSPLKSKANVHQPEPAAQVESQSTEPVTVIDTTEPVAPKDSQAEKDFEFAMPRALSNNNQEQQWPGAGNTHLPMPTERAPSSFRFLRTIESRDQLVADTFRDRVPVIRVVYAVDSIPINEAADSHIVQSNGNKNQQNAVKRVDTNENSTLGNNIIEYESSGQPASKSLPSRVMETGKQPEKCQQVSNFMELRNRKVHRPTRLQSHGTGDIGGLLAPIPLLSASIATQTRPVVRRSHGTQIPRKVMKNSQSQLSLPIISVSSNKTKMGNPLSEKHGRVLHLYYQSDILIAVQETQVSFWQLNTSSKKSHQSAKVWTALGSMKRLTNDLVIETPYAQRICHSNATPIYMELRYRSFERIAQRECPMISMYVNTYFYCEQDQDVHFKSVSLDTVPSGHESVYMTTVNHTKDFIVCHQHTEKSGLQETKLVKYTLAPKSAALACSPMMLDSVPQAIKQLNCVKDSILIGFGDTTFSFWRLHDGKIILHFNRLCEIGRNLGCFTLAHTCSNLTLPSCVMLVQYNTKHNKGKKGEENKGGNQLEIVQCDIDNSKNTIIRLAKRHYLPPGFDDELFSTITGSYLILQSHACDVEVWLSITDCQELNVISKSNYRNFYSPYKDLVLQQEPTSLTLDTLTSYILKLATSRSFS